MVSLLVLGCVHSIAHHVLSNSSSNPDKIEYDFGCCEFIFSLLCGLLVILACFSYKDSCCSGQTYGKQKANVLVVDQHGNYPSFWQAMVRNALLFLLLGFLRSSSAKQPFHDFVAKTILIKTGP
ncbi:MAG: RDD family protein [Phycisphaerae bacterium]|nr:RDD family protein [Phycisphaerae bacterium]